MRRLLPLTIALLLALNGCCGARFYDQDFCSNCPPEMLGHMKCPNGGLQDHGNRLRGLWNRATHIPPAAPVPPPNPKYHPVPTRPVFTPQP